MRTLAIFMRFDTVSGSWIGVRESRGIVRRCHRSFIEGSKGQRGWWKRWSAGGTTRRFSLTIIRVSAWEYISKSVFGLYFSLQLSYLLRRSFLSWIKMNVHNERNGEWNKQALGKKDRKSTIWGEEGGFIRFWKSRHCRTKKVPPTLR